MGNPSPERKCYIHSLWQNLWLTLRVVPDVTAEQGLCRAGRAASCPLA